MKFRNKPVCRCFLILVVALSSLAHSQIERGRSKKSNEGRPVKILYYKASKGAPSEADVYVGAEKIAETKLPTHNFSATFEIPKGDINLKFGPRSLTEDQKVPADLPSVKISESWSKVLLLVYPAEENTTMPIKVVAINASNNVFGPGSVYMINYSDVAVFGQMGNKKIEMKPKSTFVLTKPIDGAGAYPVKLNAFVKGQKVPRKFIRQMWTINNTTRKVLFIMPRPAPHYATYYSAPIRGF